MRTGAAFLQQYGENAPDRMYGAFRYAIVRKRYLPGLLVAMTARAFLEDRFPVFGAAAIAAAGLSAGGTAQAALNAGDTRQPAAFSFPDGESLVAQLAEQLGVEDAKPRHAVKWQVAQSVYCSPYKSCDCSTYSCDTTSNPGAGVQSQIVTNRILSQVLLGANEQINCSNCFSAFGSVGSFSAGAHGRYNITGQLSIRGGVAFSQYDGKGYKVTSAPIFALALRYDLADWGWARPFVDVGATATPNQNSRYTRTYLNVGVPTTGVGRASGDSYAAFVKGGWVFRLTGRDELAVYGELWRAWQSTNSYRETPLPPGGLFPSTSDRLNIAKAGVQWTHLWGTSIETHLNVGVARTFDTRVGLLPVLAALGSPAAPLRERTYFEYGARVGYRITPKLTLDVFANGAAGTGSLDQVHVGTALRFSY